MPGVRGWRPVNRDISRFVFGEHLQSAHNKDWRWLKYNLKRKCTCTNQVLMEVRCRLYKYKCPRNQPNNYDNVLKPMLIVDTFLKYHDGHIVDLS